MKKIIIMDFCSAKVFVRDIPLNMSDVNGDDIMTFFEGKLGIRANDCNYMVVKKEDYKLDIQ